MNGRALKKGNNLLITVFNTSCQDFNGWWPNTLLELLSIPTWIFYSKTISISSYWLVHKKAMSFEFAASIEEKLWFAHKNDFYCEIHQTAWWTENVANKSYPLHHIFNVKQNLILISILVLVVSKANSQITQHSGSFKVCFSGMVNKHGDISST